MGPIILLDKSALQSFSSDEIGFLKKHYFVVIPPVLIYEVLGNLSKYEGSENKFSRIADKLFVGDSRINVNYRLLLSASLSRNSVEMGRRPIVGGGIDLATSTGEKGVFFEEPPERKLIRKWQQGKYSLVDKAVSKSWRGISKSFDMDKYKKEFMEANSDIPKVKSLEEAYCEVHKLTMDIEHQEFYLKFLISEYDISPDEILMILSRWAKRETNFLCDFAPYAFYCLQVFLLFHFGLANSLVTTRPTNAIDLEYLYYLPFCMVFCSGDKFQEEVSKIFLKKDQDFVKAEILKMDLSKLKNDFDSLSVEERKERFYDYGPHPPQDPDSITFRLWKKYMKPWKPGSGNIKMNEEDKKRLLEQLRPMMDAIKDYEDKKKNE